MRLRTRPDRTDAPARLLGVRGSKGSWSVSRAGSTRPWPRPSARGRSGPTRSSPSRSRAPSARRSDLEDAAELCAPARVRAPRGPDRAHARGLSGPSRVRGDPVPAREPDGPHPDGRPLLLREPGPAARLRHLEPDRVPARVLHQVGRRRGRPGAPPPPVQARGLPARPRVSIFPSGSWQNRRRPGSGRGSRTRRSSDSPTQRSTTPSRHSRRTAGRRRPRSRRRCWPG